MTHEKRHAKIEHREQEEPSGDHGPVKPGVADQAADAAARRMAQDDGMVVEDSDPETERLRGVLCERLDRRSHEAHVALEKWQSILRARHAEGTIAKGLSKSGIRERFTEKWGEYLADQVLKIGSSLAEAAEMAPGLEQAAGIAGKVKGVVDDNTKAEQAVAELGAVDSIVFGAMATSERASTTAKERIAVMFHADVRAQAETPEIPIDQHAVIAHLDALLMEAMRASGTQSVEEQLDALKARRHLGEEIDAADERAKKSGVE